MIFFDIETAGYKSNHDLSEHPLDKLFIKFCDRRGLVWTQELAKAALYPEFGRVVSVSLGILDGETPKIVGYYGENEGRLLETVKSFLAGKEKLLPLCGHNIKNFDIPFLGKRYLINQINLPSCLNLVGKKPWEITHEDTADIWCFGAFGGTRPSLDLLCHLLGVKSPKDGLDGSQVSEYFHEKKDLVKIPEYCNKDVFATMQVYEEMMSGIKGTGHKMFDEPQFHLINTD